LMRAATAEWTPGVVRCSALTGEGIARVADALARFDAATRSRRPAHRAAQARRRLMGALHEALERAIAADTRLSELREALESEVLVGRLGVRVAARTLVAAALEGGPARSS
ncbi:MAG: hypothetical protein ACREER_06950, partial [Alphaproteobacteria bacterium]